MRHRKRFAVFGTLVACALLGGCGGEPAPGAQAAPPSPAAGVPIRPEDAARDAVRTLLRYRKEQIDGIAPAASWPEVDAVRSVGDGAWAVDVDTSRLPGGYPEQLVVEVSATGGHTGKPTR